MDNTEHTQTPTEATGQVAGFGFGAFKAACRGKHVSAAIIVLAGSILLLGGASIVCRDPDFVRGVGMILMVIGLSAWFLSSSTQSS
jgi:hypothetical protein